jgi:hypothetical protein
VQTELTHVLPSIRNFVRPAELPKLDSITKKKLIKCWSELLTLFEETVSKYNASSMRCDMVNMEKISKGRETSIPFISNISHVAHSHV